MTIPNDKRTKCEIWSRVMGYHRPVSSWNKGKRSEYNERKYFSAIQADQRGWGSRHASEAT